MRVEVVPGMSQRQRSYVYHVFCVNFEITTKTGPLSLFFE
jgi:hypothetical protein